jgi:SAM-dependent methyltransferase
VCDKDVLETGCGSGRFTEILLEAGAKVFACDMSRAVEANYVNIGPQEDYFVCQADINALPAPSNSFDIVLCIGVIQHTPKSEETIANLCRYVRPGGSVVLDHYTYGYPVTFSRKVLRSLLVRVPENWALRFSVAITRLLWPLHRSLWVNRRRKLVEGLHGRFLRLSPVVDYHDAYPQLSPELMLEWAMLDTHDTLTDVYKNFRSAEDISRCLEECGMTNIEVGLGGNGIEARARKPSSEQNT